MISLCGADGVCEAINEDWLACRIKDQLQPKSPPRRICNPLCCGLGSFGFNSGVVTSQWVVRWVVMSIHIYAVMAGERFPHKYGGVVCCREHMTYYPTSSAPTFAV